MIGRRVFGIETEFGCFVRDERVGTSETVVEAVKNYVFHKARLGLIDLTARDEAFEPARSGGFLINGGRLYIDAVGSHLEYATPECASLFDIVAHEKAGQRIVYNTLKQMNWDERVSFHNNNIDHFAGHTFGCHENYLVRTDERLPSDWHKLILPFLTTRQIFAGAGRVGGHRLEHAGFRPSLSEVADHPIDFIWVSNVYNVEPDPTVQYPVGFGVAPCEAFLGELQVGALEINRRHSATVQQRDNPLAGRVARDALEGVQGVLQAQPVGDRARLREV
jgi:proteasome accessory factor A